MDEQDRQQTQQAQGAPPAPPSPATPDVDGAKMASSGAKLFLGGAIAALLATVFILSKVKALVVLGALLALPAIFLLPLGAWRYGAGMMSPKTRAAVTSGIVSVMGFIGIFTFLRASRDNAPPTPAPVAAVAVVAPAEPTILHATQYAPITVGGLLAVCIEEQASVPAAAVSAVATDELLAAAIRFNLTTKIQSVFHIEEPIVTDTPCSTLATGKVELASCVEPSREGQYESSTTMHYYSFLGNPGSALMTVCLSNGGRWNALDASSPAYERAERDFEAARIRESASKGRRR